MSHYVTSCFESSFLNRLKVTECYHGHLSAAPSCNFINTIMLSCTLTRVHARIPRFLLKEVKMASVLRPGVALLCRKGSKLTIHCQFL